METNRLKQFQVLVETKHLRQAADMLGLSHAGLHKSMRRLEDDMGGELFFSQGKQLQITELGRKLYQKIPSFLSHEAELLGVVQPSANLPLRVGSFEVFSTHFLGPLLTQHFEDRKRVRMVELIPGDLERALLNNQVDLGVTYLPIPTAGLEFSRIRKISMGIYIKKGSFSKDPVSEIPFIVPTPLVEGTPTGARGLDAWPDQVPRKVSYEVELMESGLEIARQGLGALFLPDFIARLHNQKHKREWHLERRAMPRGVPTVQREVFVVRRRNEKESRVEKQLAKAIRLL